MTFYGYHGVYEQERRDGQRFVVDMELEFDTSIAGKSDQLEDTVNYADVHADIYHIMTASPGPSETTASLSDNTASPVNLVETLAERIADHVLTNYTLVHTIHVRITKPDVQIPNAQLNYMGVYIQRQRQRH
jgi:7,8-dihydroneopterin aldolase/epimerase/oxygenase